jgi:hypothetical protein
LWSVLLDYFIASQINSSERKEGIEPYLRLPGVLPVTPHPAVETIILAVRPATLGIVAGGFDHVYTVFWQLTFCRLQYRP